jgi:GGDEF domain-containing protein
MGLGDFIIYMKGIRTERYAFDKAERICKKISELYSYEFNKSDIALSVGISLIKGPADYSTELANAKVALVMAKKDNTSSFEFFYPSLRK